MGIEVNGEIKTTGLSFQGNNGDTVAAKNLDKMQFAIADALRKLDGKGDLSKSDIKKFEKMKPEEQIKFLNNALKDTGYKIAPVFDSESGEKTSGLNFTDRGFFMNYSKNGKLITDDSKNAGHLGIFYQK